MASWLRTLLSFLLISGTYVRAMLGGTQGTKVKAVNNGCCDSEQYQQLQDRLETLEAAVRNIVSAITSQKKGHFAPINAILERDPVLRTIFSLNNADAGISQDSTVPSGEAKHFEQGRHANNQLQRALKCSLAHLLDINTPVVSPSGKMKAVFNKNQSLEIEWTPPSSDCLKISSGIWVRVFESGEQHFPSLAEVYLAIPQKCLKRRANTSYSVVVHTLASGMFGEKRCHFRLQNDLIQCQVYTVELVPNYQSFKGRPLSIDVFVPPTSGNSTSTESLISLTAHSDSLALAWRDNTGCASQLTALHLKIFPDGDKYADSKLSINIPRSCFQQKPNEKNSFSVVLSNNHSCPVEWEPLDTCRSYTFEIQSGYWDTSRKTTFWREASIIWDTFTAEQLYSPLTTAVACNMDQFYCEGNCYENSWICDGSADCSSGIDEHNCNTECNDGFQCGPQCVPNEQVCDGKYDCLDGSDEMNIACVTEQQPEYSSTCHQIKSGFGHLSSQITLPSEVVNTDINLNGGMRWSKSVFLISVRSNQVIWLSFKKFLTPGNHTLRVYDGPYSTSPLLLSHSGASRPQSIRSSSNNLYLEIPSFNHQNYGVAVSYTSMTRTGEPFVPGCGGYIFGDGVISFPNFLLLDAEITECLWYVEAGQSGRATLLKKSFVSPNGTKLTSSEADGHVDQSEMIVSDGWNSSGEVLYDSRVTSPLQARTVTYSVSHKTTVRLLRPLSVTNKDQGHWNTSLNVSTMHMPEYVTENLTESSGTIKSPYFPTLPYESNIDYRWSIFTNPNSTIRLLFAFFDTQEGFDYIYVYDGPTMNSSLVLEKTGTTSTPFAVVSSTNQILVRFVSDDDFTLHAGFLALYSAV